MGGEEKKNATSENDRRSGSAGRVTECWGRDTCTPASLPVKSPCCGRELGFQLGSAHRVLCAQVGAPTPAPSIFHSLGRREDLGRRSERRRHPASLHNPRCSPHAVCDAPMWYQDLNPEPHHQVWAVLDEPSADRCRLNTPDESPCALFDL